MRQDDKAEWPLRPWILAIICSVAGLLFHLLVDEKYGLDLDGQNIAPWQQAAATFVAIAAIGFALTAERLRLTWAIAFAVGWGLVISLVGWFTARYNQYPSIFEFPYFSGIFAVLIAAPLFQTIRDEGAWRFPYERLHRHAWTDAVIGAASLMFVGITFMLAYLISSLFDLIGIDAIKELLDEEWFDWMLAGFAFGSAVGILRERDALVSTLQRLVMVIFSVLAPVLGVALVVFLASLPFTGLQKLWASGVPTTPLLLTAGAGAILLANAVIGNGSEDRSPSRILRISALALVLTILPLAIIAGISMKLRVDQYGWTPERIWGWVAVGVAVAYGLASWWTVYRRRLDFDDELRPMQTKLAIGLCGLALFLALPILDFGAISARSQMARLNSGEVTPEKFDWTAMAFDFGPAGRKRLEKVARSGPAAARDLAKAALTSESRYRTDDVVEEVAKDKTLDSRLRLLSPDIQLTPKLRKFLTGYNGCDDGACALLRVDANRLLLLTNVGSDKRVAATFIDTRSVEKERSGGLISLPDQPVPTPSGINLGSAKVEIRTVPRRQAFVNGQPAGETFE